MSKENNVYLGELLVDQKVITDEQLRLALVEQRKGDDFIGEAVVNLGFAEEHKVFSLLSEKINIPYVKLKESTIDESVIKSVPAKFAYHYKIMPIARKDNILTVTMSDPLEVATRDDLELLLGVVIDPVLARKQDILEAITRYYGVGAETLEGMKGKVTPGVKDASLSSTEEIKDLALDASVVRLVNQILIEAFQKRATDIHVEPYEDEVRIRYRIDGILCPIQVPEELKHFHHAIISRIKIMSSLNIAEKRLPQDGRIKVKISGEELNLRVSILPTPFGESVNIRLLNTNIRFGLKSLGLLEKDFNILEEMIKKPHGIILVTGPTGSGKTTTLYACLDTINDAEKKIVTIEDPIEYQLKGVTQVQIHPQIDLSFARGLRSMLRHDPDIMMVGEIRDYETAEIAVRVALTGHLVFSTLHTNDASGAVTRLLDMGVEPFLVSSSVICIVAQRLVRLICPHCKTKIPLDKSAIEELSIKWDVKSETEIFEGKGCSHCRFTGYLGRTAIYEVLVLDEEIRELILQRVSTEEIKQVALKSGIRTLRQDGWEKVIKGLTTVSEILRVTQEESD